MSDNATKRTRMDWRYEFERVVSRENEKRVSIVTANLDVAMKRTRASLDFPHKGGAGTVAHYILPLAQSTPEPDS